MGDVEVYTSKERKGEGMMDKLERGTRNIKQMESIKHGGRKAITFWNPNPSDTMRVTVHSQDAGLLVQIHDALSENNRTAFLKNLATVSGLMKMTEFAWQHAEFRRV